MQEELINDSLSCLPSALALPHPLGLLLLSLREPFLGHSVGPKDIRLQSRPYGLSEEAPCQEVKIRPVLTGLNPPDHRSPRFSTFPSSEQPWQKRLPPSTVHSMPETLLESQSEAALGSH